MDAKIKNVEVITVRLDECSDCIDLKYAILLEDGNNHILDIKGIDLSNITFVSELVQACGHNAMPISSLDKRGIAFPYEEFILRG